VVSSANGTERVLVTGAAGRLGLQVMAHLGARAVAFDGDARDVEAVRTAMAGVQAVIHLAAIPSPNLGSGEEVFGNNVLATYTVLELAGQAGVRRAAIASSYSVTGLPFGPVFRAPAYLPIDESLPLHIADPYALSKHVDEATGAMMWWRYGLSVVALRFPFLGTPEKLAERAARYADVPGDGAREVWGYLDFRDAARACALALTEPGPGFHTVSLAAPVTLAPYPTDDLLATFLPWVPLKSSFPGRQAPFDLSRAEALLGFRAEHLHPVEEREWKR
jgi:nucleoside-diphosphate-sugar epimerase